MLTLYCKVCLWFLRTKNRIPWLDINKRFIFKVCFFLENWKFLERDIFLDLFCPKQNSFSGQFPSCLKPFWSNCSSPLRILLEAAKTPVKWLLCCNPNRNERSKKVNFGPRHRWFGQWFITNSIQKKKKIEFIFKLFKKHNLVNFAHLGLHFSIINPLHFQIHFKSFTKNYWIFKK